MEFLQWLRLVSSSRRAQRLELGVATGGGRVLSAKTCNRVMAAVSSFYEFLIATEAYAGRDNPIVKVAVQAAARVPGRYRPPLDNASPQRPVRRVLRVKTVEALPRPMTAEILRRAAGRAAHPAGPGAAGGDVGGRAAARARFWACGWRTSPTGSGGSPSASAMIIRGRCGRSRAGTGSWTCWKAAPCPQLSDYVMRERPADADCPWVFLVGGKGKRRCEPLSYDAMVRMFARAAERAGVRDAWLTPHSLGTRMPRGCLRPGCGS